MKTARSRFIALIVGLVCAVPAAFADDIDIYTNASDSPLRKPLTILVLDLNLLGICDSTGLVTPTSNPDSLQNPQLCLDLQNTLLLDELLGGLTDDPEQFLTDLLFGADDDKGDLALELCDLYGLLGLDSPIGTLPVLGPLLKPLLGGISTLSCATVGLILAIPIVGPIVEATLDGFIGQLVSGLVDPLLTTVVGQLPQTVIGLLNTTVSGVLNLGQIGLIGLLESILNQLIDSEVAIMVSHADRSNAAGNGAADCAFGDEAAIAMTRRETPNCSNGAYFLLGPTPLIDDGTVVDVLAYVGNLLGNILDLSNIGDALTATLATAVTSPTQLLPPYQGKEVYVEIAQLLSGGEVYNAPLDRWDGLTGLIGRDHGIESGGHYQRPDLECRTANVLNIQLTQSVVDTESDARLAELFPGAVNGGDIAFVDLVREAQEIGFDDGTGHTVTLSSHFIVQENLSSFDALVNVGANVTTYANNLGLLNLGKTAAQLLQPTLVVDASLLTPSQTFDLSQPGRVTGDAYFGLFRPAEDMHPRWDGNLKKLALESDNGSYSYVDVNGDEAIADDGRIKPGALSFWTETGGKLGGRSGDGRDATLGGAGQRIPGYQYGGGGNPGRSNSNGKRKLFYDHRASFNGALSLRGLDADAGDTMAELQPDLGAANASEAQELLLYVRGFEVGTSSASKGTSSSLKGREWMHGAVLHSRPVAINYGARGSYSDDNPDVRLVYGAADGFLRMLRNTNSGGAESGVEAWAFMPRVLMKTQKVLRDNQPGGPIPHGVDGAPSVLLIDRDSSGHSPGDGKIESSNANDHAYLFFGVGRGANLQFAGSSYIYALDVTDPDNPELLWRIGADGLYRASGGVSSGQAWYASLAMSTSAPQVGRLRLERNGAAEAVDVLIFGGGYYGGHGSANESLYKDMSGTVGSDDLAGKGVYIVDALTGELIWRTETGATMAWNGANRSFRHPLIADSIAADLSLVDSDGDGYTDRLYALDTGGRLWRADLPGSDPADWTYGPLASVGRHNHSDQAASLADDRRFFQAPDYVPFRDDNGVFDAVVFASGNRAAPLSTATNDYLYMYRDTRIRSGKMIDDLIDTESGLAQQADFVDLTQACASGQANCADGKDLSNGWKLSLTGAGEKALSQPLTSGGVVFLSSYLPTDPDEASCEPREGDGRFYAVSLSDSRPVDLSQFADDGDGDARSTLSATPGLSGQFDTLGRAVTANTETFPLRTRRFYDVYWRERRGDEALQ